MGAAPLAGEAIRLVRDWLERAAAAEVEADRRSTGPLQELVAVPEGLAFVMQFVDRVMRSGDDRTAAVQLRSLLRTAPPPDFLSLPDRMAMRLGAALGPRLPRVVMATARRRMRSLVGHLVVDGREERLLEYLEGTRSTGFGHNVNLLGEAVLGEAEAERRLLATAGLIDQSEVDYVSVKVTAVASQLNYWDWEGTRERVLERLRVLFRRAMESRPPTFINLDMEEYRDLQLTLAVFKRLLSEPDFRSITAGVVLQAYLPDSYAALRDLVEWATERRRSGGGEIKIRLVKGANLAMERVEAAIHGWEQAPYSTKAEVDANYKRLVDWVLTPDRTEAVRVGVGSHNLFDVAWAHLLSRRRGVEHRVEFEMLAGMAPAHARVVRDSAPDGRLLLYTPIVGPESFDVAIGYLFRRLEENTAEGNFLRVLFDLAPDSAEFDLEAERFRVSVSDRATVSEEPRRLQVRPSRGAFASGAEVFMNEPDSDPSLAGHRDWARAVVAMPFRTSAGTVLSSTAEVDAALEGARASVWNGYEAEKRRSVLHGTADELARRRGDLINAMIHEGRKTFAQADAEVSEAIDFARYYGDRALELGPVDGAAFRPLGVVAVIPPWNFPVAIPAGGVLAALAAGNTALLKPSSRTPRCAEIVAECARTAGIPAGALQFVEVSDHSARRHLVTAVDGVILTGSAETARLFQSWKPELRLFAETSGKNAMVVTPSADLDQAVADLVASAFGHAGQKCSAASLVICVGSVYRSERFRRQLVDAIESLVIGPASEPATTVGPLIAPAGGKLLQGLTDLGPGERWLVTPVRMDDGGELWRPGVRLGVRNGSWFHQTECFGPVLGVMHAPTLQAAVTMQNGTPFGLTGGIHSLDPDEVDYWLERVEVGNAYVNRGITGAVVQRQPFGGWKGSNIGPGAKTGGPNYVRQLGVWSRVGAGDLLAEAAASDRFWWEQEFGREHDPTGLFCEANVFRYRPLDRVAVRVGSGSSDAEVARVEAAAQRCGVSTVVSDAADETHDEFASRLPDLGVERVRTLGVVPRTIRVAAGRAGIHLVDQPVTSSGRVELPYYLKERSVSRTLHRFGNVVGQVPTP